MVKPYWKLQYAQRPKKPMPIEAIRKMLKSPNVPEHLKKAWRKKLREM